MTVQEAIKWLKHPRHSANEVSERLEALQIAIESMEEVEQYRALGTVEELKEAREKQVAKKPTEIHEIEDGTFYRIDFMCPSCDTSVVGQPYKPNYCKHCGQKLDWEEGAE